MRLIAIFVIILGVAGLVLGIVFITQASSAEKTILTEIAPLTSLSEITPHYNQVTAAFNKQMATEEPNIQAGKAAPSAMYAYLSGQRALLGLAKSNVGLALFIRMSGITAIVLGIGMALAGSALLVKKS